MQSVWMLVSSFFFSLMAAFTKLGAQDFGTFELVFYRQIVGCGLIFIWVMATHRTVLTHLFPSHLKRSLLGTLALMIWVYAIGQLPLGTAMTLNYTNPLFMAAIVSYLAVRHGEPLQKKLIGCVLFGFFGITLILRPDVGASDVLPSLIGSLSGFFAALAQFQVRQLAQMREPEWRIVFYFTLTGTVAALIGHFIWEGGLTPITSENIWALAGMAIAGVIAQLAMTRAWNGGNVLVTSCFQFSAIIFASLIGWISFDEPISLLTGTGIGVIIIAGVTATMETRKKKHLVKKPERKPVEPMPED